MFLPSVDTQPPAARDHCHAVGRQPPPDTEHLSAGWTSCLEQAQKKRAEEKGSRPLDHLRTHLQCGYKCSWHQRAYQRSDTIDVECEVRKEVIEASEEVLKREPHKGLSVSTSQWGVAMSATQRTCTLQLTGQSHHIGVSAMTTAARDTFNNRQRVASQRGVGSSRRQRQNTQNPDSRIRLPEPIRWGAHD